MTKKVLFVAVLALLMVAIGAWNVEAKSYTPKTEKAKRLEAMEQYQFLFKKRYDMPREAADQGTRGGMTPPPASLGTRTTASPGEIAGFSYYDLMRNAATGRSIDWRYDQKIHMTWTFLPTSDPGFARQQGYNLFDPENDNWPLGVGVGTGLPDQDNRTGFGGLDVYYKAISGGLTSNAIVTAHTTRAATGLKTETYYQDFAFAAGDFSSNRITAADQAPYVVTDDLIWPIVEFHVNGTDSVTHVACMGSFDDDPDRGELVVFSKVGNGTAGAWTSQGFGLVASQCYSLTASRSSQKVAVVYLVRTAATNPGSPNADFENDVVYNVSTNMGTTWGLQQNVTNYDVSVDGYRAWIESACLYDTDDDLHIVWNGGEYTVADGAGSRECRLFHWTEKTGLTTTVYNGVWGDLFGLQECIGGSNVMNASKFSVSQCDTNLYVIWQQVNDPPNGLFDDCASDATSSLLWNGNHELYLSVSVGLDGIGWDTPRNLTTSYTPDCDTTGINGDCDNDVMATMSRYGMDNSAFSGTFVNAGDALTVDPSGGAYSGTYFLDVLYLNDQFPGTGVYTDQGPLTRNDIKWFRLPCVDPVVQAELFLSETSIGYPNYVMHGQDTTFTLVLENGGNTTLNITDVNTPITSGPSGWLTTNAVTPINIQCCIDPLDSIEVTINTSGIVNTPGTIVALNGQVEFVSNDPNSPQTFDIVDFLVADTVVGAEWDTLSTSCITLAVGNNGNMGNAGNGPDGLANMNFLADCDNLDPDTIPGDASVYLYDASPVILKVEGTDTLASWSIFADNFATPNGFKPIESDPAPGTFSGSNYEATYSGKFVTADSSLTLEKAVYFPTNADSCNFVVQVMCIYATDGTAQNGLAIGEAWDWDIPSDTAVRNSAGSDPFENVVWLRGGEWNEPLGDSLECQDNDARFGGAGLIGYEDGAGSDFSGTPANFYTALNSDFVLPAGGFIPGELYENMQINSGISAVPSSTIEDQHMVMTVFKDYNLAAGDTLTIYMAMGVVENGTDADMVAAIEDARAWYTDNAPLSCRPSAGGCCVGETGDVNGSGGSPTLTDLTILVNRLFVTFDWGATACPASANTNGDAACALTLTDLTLLVNKLFVTFEATAQCTDFDQSNCEPPVGLK